MSEVWKELGVPGTTDKIILLNPDLAPRDQPYQNLTRRSAAGDLLWVAELPSGEEGTGGSDAYTEVRWLKGGLFANSWSCYFCEIDPLSGRILSQEFTK